MIEYNYLKDQLNMSVDKTWGCCVAQHPDVLY